MLSVCYNKHNKKERGSNNGTQQMDGSLFRVLSGLRSPRRAGHDAWCSCLCSLRWWMLRKVACGRR